MLIPYITTYSCVRLCSGVYFFSVVELVFTTLDILASLCSAVDEHCQIEPTRRVIMISPVAVLPNTLHSYAVMCSCCSRILCIQPTNSITLKGSMRDKVPSPLPLQTLSSEIITEPFNAVWWAASRSASCRLHRLAPGKEKAHFETVTLKYCILDNCLMESSKIENLINVWRRLDQAALKDIVFNSRWGERKSRSLLHLDILKDAANPLVLLTSTMSSTLTIGIFRFVNYLSKLSPEWQM